MIAEGTAGDHTGIINFRVVGENASKLKKDAVVAFRNLKSSVFNERHRLEIDLWGKISEEPTIKIEKIN